MRFPGRGQHLVGLADIHIGDLIRSGEARIVAFYTRDNRSVTQFTSRLQQLNLGKTRSQDHQLLLHSSTFICHTVHNKKT